MLHLDRRSYPTGWALVGLLVGVCLLPGCSLTATPEAVGLTVKIDSPASGMELQRDQKIAIQSTANGPKAVSWIELWVDGELLETAQAPTPLQPRFSTVQLWQPSTPGESLVEVRAYDEKGTGSPPDSIIIRVSDEAVEPIQPPVKPETGSLAIPTVTPLPTMPLPTATPTALLCERNAKFAEDVTVPDDTVITAGAAFVKTWRVRNNGTCPWEGGYELAFVEGEQMGGPDSSPAPTAEPESETDVSVSLMAPERPGKYRGDWKMRSPDGEIFGGKLYVQIVVTAPTATPRPTATSSPTRSVPAAP